ncbi:MAG: ribosome-associated translation inhibitor RaiA [Actinomycetota bacterium]|nr:ribosome-associated translation inhibitor RaiA [Actinomycetota bacterium]
MRLEVKGRNVEVNDSIRSYAAEKLDRIDKQLPEPTQIEVELTLETNPSIADDHVAEATVWTKGSTLRVRERSAGFESSIDQLVDKLERQVKRYREKRSRRETGRRASVNGHSSDPPAFSGEQLNTMIVKSKQFDLQPLTPEEATVELELIGHDFFVFVNIESGQQNVVYRRDGGGYGLIEPQE